MKKNMDAIVSLQLLILDDLFYHKVIDHDLYHQALARIALPGIYNNPEASSYAGNSGMESMIY